MNKCTITIDGKTIDMNQNISEMVTENYNTMDKLHFNSLSFEVPLTPEQAQDLEYFRTQLLRALSNASIYGEPHDI